MLGYVLQTGIRLSRMENRRETGSFLETLDMRRARHLIFEPLVSNHLISVKVRPNILPVRPNLLPADAGSPAQ